MKETGPFNGYCECNSTKKGILERLPIKPTNPMFPDAKYIMPSFICPDCRKHRKLETIKLEQCLKGKEYDKQS